MTLFDAVLFAVAALAGGVASVSGFGIGSLLTPLLGIQAGTRAAVAAVAIPHALATALRYWPLRREVDWGIVRTFGIMSAAGGLAGALLHGALRGALLTAVFAVLLAFAGITGLTGVQRRMRFRGWAAWLAGALSGVFGGLVGNQGGIRSAALLGFEVRRDAFVASATVIGLFVDAARLPAYLLTEHEALLRLWPQILIMSAGCLLGTLLGVRVLSRVPERIFGKLVSSIILALGLWMGFRAWAEFRGS